MFTEGSTTHIDSPAQLAGRYGNEHGFCTSRCNNNTLHATIDLIAKKGIDFLLDYFPKHGQRFIFNKEVYKGLSGAFKFGRQISTQKKYDIFFCLPDSFSSAVMAYATNANKKSRL